MRRRLSAGPTLRNLPQLHSRATPPARRRTHPLARPPPRLHGDRRHDALARIGPRAVGQNDHLAQINVDYKLPRWPAISLNLTGYSYGRRAATLDNTVVIPGTRSLDVGARYRFELFRAPASLRVLVQNAGNVYSWALTDSAGFSPAPRRSIQIYLTADF